MNFKIFEAMPGNSVLLQANNPDFTVAAATQGYLQLVQQSGQDVVSKGFSNIFKNEADADTTISLLTTALQRVVTAKKPQTTSLNYNGWLSTYNEHTTTIYTVLSQPVLDDAGELAFIIQTVNETKATVTAPQETVKQRLIEQAYNLLMNAPVAFCIIQGPEQIIQLANKPVLEIWRKDETVIGKPLLEALPEIKDSVFPELLHQVRTSGKSYFSNESSTYFLRNGKEELVYFNYVYQPFYENDSTEASGVLVVAIEVTEMVLARKKVEESEMRFRNLIAEADVATAIYTGAEMKIQYANEAMIKLWGKDKSVVGKKVSEALPELEGQAFIPLLQQVYKTGETYWGKEDRGEIMVDGKLQAYYFNFSYKALRNADGDIYGILNMAIDVTSEVIAKQKVEESEANLQKRVAERTIELENMNRELQHMNVNLGEFAFAASHDLKEPVRKIHYFSDRLSTLLAGRLSNEEQRILGRMQHATRRMSTLIDDLLTYYHASKGLTTAEEVNLNAKVDDVLEDLELEIAEKNAQVEVGALPVIYGNKRQLQQLFQNIISNALKYSRQGVQPLIQIAAQNVKGSQTPMHLSEEDGEKPYYKIEVKDNGIGFNQKDAERMFNIFTRLHGNAEYRGTGIGLSIVQKVVENHKGFVMAQGTPGQGATFAIFLPVNGVATHAHTT